MGAGVVVVWCRGGGLRTERQREKECRRERGRTGSASGFAPGNVAQGIVSVGERATGTGMNWHTRNAVVAAAANSWRQLERAWTIANTEA